MFDIRISDTKFHKKIDGLFPLINFILLHMLFGMQRFSQQSMRNETQLT